MVNKTRLDLLLAGVEAAWRELNLSRKSAEEFRQDKSYLPIADGNDGLALALRSEELATQKYLRALGNCKAALMPDTARLAETDSKITHREREVLTLIASGKTSKDIATQLGVSFKTVVCHRYRVQQKLHAHNTADLTRAAMRMGLIEP
jgi:DNA-binding NarL/FixJ family response regulator